MAAAYDIITEPYGDPDRALRQRRFALQGPGGPSDELLDFCKIATSCLEDFFVQNMEQILLDDYFLDVISEHQICVRNFKYAYVNFFVSPNIIAADKDTVLDQMRTSWGLLSQVDKDVIRIGAVGGLLTMFFTQPSQPAAI